MRWKPGDPIYRKHSGGGDFFSLKPCPEDASIEDSPSAASWPDPIPDNDLDDLQACPPL